MADDRDSMGRFLPGRKKTGGRQKGTIPKVDRKMKDWLADFLERKTEDFEAAYSELSAREKFAVLAHLLPYVLPKQTSANLTIDASIQQYESLQQGISNINRVFGIEDVESEDSEE